MCEECGWDSLAAEVEEDVRATKTHAVYLTILVEAEDARRAADRILSAYDGTDVEVSQVRVMPFEREERDW